MSTVKLLIYIAIMMVVTYGVRVLPLLLIRKPIHSVFLKSFLSYVPYAVLGAMTFPAMIHSTGILFTGICGFVVGVILAFFNRSLFTVAMGSCVAVLLAQLVVGMGL